MAFRFRSIHRQMLRFPRATETSIPLACCVPPHQALSSLPPTARTFASGSVQKKRIRRRERPNFGRAKIEGTGPPKILPETTGLDQPYAYGGEDGTSTEEYLKKTSLSPWVPIPDPIARKLFDMSAPSPEDVRFLFTCIVLGVSMFNLLVEVAILF